MMSEHHIYTITVLILLINQPYKPKITMFACNILVDMCVFLCVYNYCSLTKPSCSSWVHHFSFVDMLVHAYQVINSHHPLNFTCRSSLYSFTILSLVFVMIFYKCKLLPVQARDSFSWLNTLYAQHARMIWFHFTILSHIYCSSFVVLCNLCCTSV